MLKILLSILYIIVYVLIGIELRKTGHYDCLSYSLGSIITAIYISCNILLTILRRD